MVDTLLRYRDGLPLAITGLSARIEGGQKVGVVGRTGAGKSSLAAILFRLVEVSGGRLLVDGVDVSKIGLRTLRRAITVIPQDPTLMEGTIRDNLDPFHKFTDAEVSVCLSRCGEKTFDDSCHLSCFQSHV
jgi:ABC-type multidrug transport system fused ATPase/permease subunit